MRKLLGFGLIAVVLGCTGCVLTQTEIRPPAPVATTTVARPSPLITASQVTVENRPSGHATKLREELDREAKQAKLDAESP